MEARSYTPASWSTDDRIIISLTWLQDRAWAGLPATAANPLELLPTCIFQASLGRRGTGPLELARWAEPSEATELASGAFQ